ncbi:MAG: 16S rRNA (guanine(966)-N(2))-methyltransferase RsmD [Eubacteriales bacterium]|nr:16S rRNA (guanine(966)-N(2))-methyltransferase RsmD [Eubacteriales bacterium]
MRVIAGTARRLQLKTAPGQDTRPTTDRIKETLFNMLGSSVYGCRFLDLFSGSGAIGIEALSRGAETAFFVEQGREALRCIRENLRFTKLEQKAQVLALDVFEALKRLDGQKAFDIIFMDPPYNRGLEREVLEALAESGLADSRTLIIAEASAETEFDYVDSLGFETVKYKKYKTNAHIFIKRKVEGEDA